MLFQVIVKAQRVNSVAGKADSSDSCWMSTLGITGESFQARHLNFWKFPFLVQFSCSVMFDALQPHGLQHTRLPCPSPTPELAQTHVHWVGDAIKLSHPLSSPSPAFNLSQLQDLLQWVSSSHQVAKVLELQVQHQFFQWIFRTDFL